MHANICISDWVFIYRNNDTVSIWKGQDCDDSQNNITNCYNMKLLLVCRFKPGSRYLFRSEGDVPITSEGLHSVVMEC